MEGIGDHACKVPNQKCVSANYFQHNTEISVETAQTSFIDDFIRPINAVNEYGPWEFNLESLSESYLQMMHIELEMKFQVFRTDGSKLEATDNVACINNIGHSMFKNIEVKLNSSDFHGNSSVNAGLKSYIEHILSLEKCAVETHAQASGFFLDSEGAHDAVDQTNDGFVKRKEMIKLSRICDVYTKIPNDFLRSDNFLVANNKLSIRLTKNNDEFLLMTDSETQKYQIKMKDLKLFLEDLI